MSEQVFHLPDVGEGLTEAEIVSWQVKPGDSIELNTVVCEIETAKSLVELPSPFTGVVSEVLAQVGETVPVGTPILKVRVEGADPQAPTPEAPTDSAAEASDTDISAASDEGGGAVLVGYGTAGPAKSRRNIKKRTTEGSNGAFIHVSTHDPGAADEQQAAPERPLAKPPARKLAKDLGVDLATVRGTGPAGVVLRDDVMRHHGGEQVSSGPAATRAPSSDWPTEREERIAVRGVRKFTAQAMVDSAFTAPHVSVFVDVDATRTMEFVQRLKNNSEFEGVRVSPLLIMARAVIWAIRRNPMVNATFTDEEITVHNYVNLGIAAATPRGLVVPNIKDAHTLSLLELARALEQLATTARAGRTAPADMQQGTMTITNFGVFGIDSGTPIINPGESAIIGMGSIRQKPWVVDGQVVPRWVTTVGGSFDHRVVDGDVISRFTADVASIIEEPALLLD